MEVLKTPYPKSLQITPTLSLLKPTFSIKTHNNKTQFKFNTSFSKRLLIIPFWVSSPLPQRSKFQISSHFGRPTNRRNSLRKKLSEIQQVSHDNPIPINQSSNFENPNQDFIDNLVESNSIEKSKLLGDSDLLSKLENWVDQYKNDVEFWGVGFNPIFTVFQDLNGNVNRVSVDEDEIMRRIGEFEEMGLESKILRANSMAKEIENGNYVMPKSSSVAKFVVSSEKSGFIDEIRSFVARPDMFLKVSRVGFVVICGLFVFWTLKRLVSFGNDEVELTREEKEMLRRKMKSRMEKENLEKGSVEVLQGSSEPLVGSNERPRLDKQELMNNIIKANVLNDVLELPDSSTSQTNESMDFDHRIREIREMARRAREEEKGDIVEENDNDLHDTEDGNINTTSTSSNEISDINGNIEVDKNERNLHLPDLDKPIDSSRLEKSSNLTKPRVIRSVKEAREYLSLKQKKPESNQTNEGLLEPSVSPTKINDAEEGHGNGDTRIPTSSRDGEDRDSSKSPEPSKDNWIEKNFHELEPVLKRIGVGFKDNYMVAKEKVNQELSLSSEMNELGSNEDDGEFAWMKDDKLRDIVFRVRDNELSGKDPFYLMDEKDKLAFFNGLERKVEKENEKLGKVHEWIHSNIENLDYGAEGISVYDPPEKIIPRWKGPPVDKIPEFLNNFSQQRKAEASVSNPVKNEVESQKSKESLSHETTSTSKKQLMGRDSKNPKTIIEGSDGSVRAGKKSGKEFWEHTKKWSRGFWQSYNEESDPEMKSIKKDMGKDLDRWITEDEIKEAGELMTKMPKSKKIFIEKKIKKLKREMEMFGPQAVVSKYREYAEEEAEDYLWWLDLPFVLCIELYANEDGDQRTGFYSLEMATDLELEPKPHHVIAFEDANDCKNFCYIIQAHMEMLGNGAAFVVARPPKDAFREAKANGFSVTVIRKGEMKLNVDQTLEEVEEQITEIGSKMYHDMITREHSLDTSSLMKGMLGASKSTNKRKKSKRARKKPRKS